MTTTPDPTAVAAVIDGLEEALLFAIREHIEPQHLAEYLQPDDMAMHPPSEESVAAWNSVAGEIVRHLAAQAMEADKALVEALSAACFHRQANAKDLQTALLARLAQRPAPAIDQAELLAWLGTEIATQQGVLDRTTNVILQQIVTGRLQAYSRTRDHLNGIDEYPEMTLNDHEYEPLAPVPGGSSDDND